MTDPLPPAKVLIVEDDLDWLEIYTGELKDETYELDTSRSVRQAIRKIQQTEFDVVATDLYLFGGKGAEKDTGMDILKHIKSTQPDLQVIIFTAYGAANYAMEALQHGAYDFLTKPLDYSHARATIRAAIEVRRHQLAKRQGLLSSPDRFLYTSEPMREVVNQAAHLANQGENILILGAHGTGKGLLAETIHFSSPRKDADLALINCTSLSERTLERSLFGYTDENGRWHPGYFQTLAGGTLVLDSISGLNDNLQSMMAEVLRERRLAIGTNGNYLPLDIRIIGIDQVNLTEYVEAGLFRSDLFNLVAQAIIKVPPLRERWDKRYNDIIHLAQYFIFKYGTVPIPELTPETTERLINYPFPENVRELRTVIRFAVANVKNDKILPENLPSYVLLHGSTTGLGVVADSNSPLVLCPHINDHCNQVKTIREGFLNAQRVYLRASSVTSPEFIEQVQKVVNRSGFTIQRPVLTEDKRTSHCRYCMPIQMSRYAVLDLVANDPTLGYEIGLLHSLGVSTLLLKQTGVNTPDLPPDLNVIEYRTVDQIGDLIEKWLRSRAIN